MTPVITLGKAGSEGERIYFAVRPGSGLMVRRPGAVLWYEPEFTIQDGILQWITTKSDTAIAGWGDLRITEDGAPVPGKYYKTEILPA